MKKKEKIVGSIAILVLCSLFLIIGYFISSGEKKPNYDDIFVEYKDNKSEQVYNKGKKDILKNNGNTTVKANNEEKESNDNEEKEHNDEETIGDKSIKVDIKGAVKKPGIYTLKDGSRIADLVELAGGFTGEADDVSVYLSKKLHDENFIYIKKRGETPRKDLPIDTSNKDNNKTNENTTGASPNGSSSNGSGSININTATLEQLKTLPGIGDVKAQSIMSYRESHGGFKTIDELRNIEGIGEKTLNKFRDKVDIK